MLATAGGIYRCPSVISLNTHFSLPMKWVKRIRLSWLAGFGTDGGWSSESGLARFGQSSVRRWCGGYPHAAPRRLRPPRRLPPPGRPLRAFRLGKGRECRAGKRRRADGGFLCSQGGFGRFPGGAKLPGWTLRRAGWALVRLGSALVQPGRAFLHSGGNLVRDGQGLLRLGKGFVRVEITFSMTDKV